MTRVRKAAREKGKSIVHVGTSSKVTCKNGFEALRISNDPLVALDKGP